MVGHCDFSHGEDLSINNRCPLPLPSLQLIITRNLDQSVRCMLVHTTCTVLFVMSVNLVGQEQHDQFKALLSNPAPLHLLRQCYLPELSPTLFPNFARQEIIFIYLYLSAFTCPALEASESVLSHFAFYANFTSCVSDKR